MRFNNLPEALDESSINVYDIDQPSANTRKSYSLKFWLFFIPLLLLFLFCAAITIQHFQEKYSIEKTPTIQVQTLEERPSLNKTENLPVTKPESSPSVKSNPNITSQNPPEKTPEENNIKITTQTEPETPTEISDRPLIMMAYYEKASLRANAEFFIQHGLHARADFIFLINGDSDLDTILPKNASNIRVIRRGNSCFDLGSMGEILLANDSALVKKYKKFILMNASIRGPFLPRWSEDCWSDKFLKRINDKVKLVGMLHNCIPIRHVQSMILASDDVGIRILLNGTINDDEARVNPNDFYGQSLAGLNYCPQTPHRAASAEMSLTNLIHRAGYTVDVLMTEAGTKNYYETCIHNNPAVAALHYGYNTHPYESIFVKANKDPYDTTTVNKLTEWHNNIGYSSWEACSAKI